MFLIVLAVVWEVGISCRARELKCLVRSQVFWVEKKWRRKCISALHSKQFTTCCIYRCRSKENFTGRSSRLWLWVFSVLHTSKCFWFSAVTSNSVSSLLPATNFTECRKSSVILNMAFMAKHTLF